MTRFVAAVLVVTAEVVKTAVDPRVAGTENLGTRPSAMLATAVTRARRERLAGGGVETVRRAGRRVRPGQQRREGS